EVREGEGAFAGTRGACATQICRRAPSEKKKPSPESFRSWVLATSYSRTAYRRTTIGAAAFHCRVRNGNGWGHCASVTRNLRRACRHKFLVRDPRFEIRDSWFGVILPNYDSRFTNFDSPTIHSSLCQRTADSLIST